MKIGILTFHWATNYGAVLQCYALQSYLEEMGYDVDIINYKPHQYDDNIYSFLRFRKFFNIADYCNTRKKETALKEFRNKLLHLTERVNSCKEVVSIVHQYDAIISGSDQVMNPTFLLSGEGKHIVTPTYFLGFHYNGKRIGYALSFGCVKYPEYACKVASKYIKDFDVITVRENTGVGIVKSMGRYDAKVVPDPTILISSEFYHNLADKSPKTYASFYIYSFFIRNMNDRKIAINNTLKGYNILWNNDDYDYSMEGWLRNIKHAKFVITDSFHCMVMCLKFHVHFAIITEKEGNVGMNDRLYTLLEKCGLTKCILHKSHIDNVANVFEMNIKWDDVDTSLLEYCNVGKSILGKYLN